MENKFILSEYINHGVQNIVKGIVKASLKNPKETAFITKYVITSRESKKKREKFLKRGQNVPAFLICSITSNCNLFCKGCYARANKSCGQGAKKGQMMSDTWERIFSEAREMGISFILLAGGEPLLRKDVIEKAAREKAIMFPIFTNGTMLQQEYLELFDKNRNLVPMLSIEGNMQQTDERRGEGTYNILMSVINKLYEKGILYGVSVTVTTRNVDTVTSKTFFQKLYNRGCKALIFVEYVPVTEETRELAPTDRERKIVESGQQKLREYYDDAIFLSFPGDEKYSGGCLAAGRGFFHVNVDGAAEPCPFSPYSDTNLNDTSLIQALKSPLFKELNETGMLVGEHEGGCLLFEKSSEVRKIVNTPKMFSNNSEL